MTNICQGGVQNKPQKIPDEPVRFVEGQGEIHDASWGYNKKQFVVSANTGSVLGITNIYYPGWKATVSDKNVTIDYQNDEGLMRITIPKGEHKIDLTFTKIWWRATTEAISFITILIIIFLGALFIFRQMWPSFFKKRN